MYPQAPTTATLPRLIPSIEASTQAPISATDSATAQPVTAPIEIKESAYKAIASRVVECAYEKEVSYLDCEEFNNGDRVIFIDGTIYANQEHLIEQEVGYNGVEIISLRYDLECTAFDLEGANYAATDFDQTRLEKYL